MNSRRWILIGIVATAFAGSYLVKRSVAGRTETPVRPGPGVSRIISLAPSTTEVLFALGLGDRVVGVTRYCQFPPEARGKQQVGGYYDPNYEAIVQARPDLVLTLPEHEEIRRELQKLNLAVLTVDHGTLRGILESVTTVGAACGVPDKAREVRGGLESRLRQIEARTAGRSRPRVLVSIGRMAGDESMSRITACGPGGFYDDLIRLAGGVNAFEREILFAALSPEGVLAIKPDVIIDLWPDLEERGMDPDAVRRLWKVVPGITARVHVVGESYGVVPGPRVVALLEDMVRGIHPEALHD